MVTMMRCYWIGVVAVALLGACCHMRDATCEKRAPALENAVQAAGVAVHKAYRSRLPADFDAKAYLAAARAYPLLDSQIEALQAVDLEVWTKSDCEGAIVVARCRETQRVILFDDTASTSTVEQPDALANPEAKPPARPNPPPTCAAPAHP